jgi:hypothetical protein
VSCRKESRGAFTVKLSNEIRTPSTSSPGVGPMTPTPVTPPTNRSLSAAAKSLFRMTPPTPLSSRICAGRPLIRPVRMTRR